MRVAGAIMLWSRLRFAGCGAPSVDRSGV